MNKYTIYCTPEQTKRALELGAPITTRNDRFDEHVSPICKEGEQWLYAIIPTAEQMIGWLEEQKNISIEISRQYGIDKYCYYVFNNYGNDIESLENKIKLDSRKEVILAAIDAALDYLIKNKMEEHIDFDKELNAFVDTELEKFINDKFEHNKKNA